MDYPYEINVQQHVDNCRQLLSGNELPRRCGKSTSIVLRVVDHLTSKPNQQILLFGRSLQHLNDLFHIIQMLLEEIVPAAIEVSASRNSHAIRLINGSRVIGRTPASPLYGYRGLNIDVLLNDTNIPILEWDFELRSAIIPMCKGIIYG